MKKIIIPFLIALLSIICLCTANAQESQGSTSLQTAATALPQEKESQDTSSGAASESSNTFPQRKEETKYWHIVFQIIAIAWTISLPIMGVLYFIEFRRKWEDLPAGEQKNWTREATRQEFNDLHAIFDARKEFEVVPEGEKTPVLKKLISSRHEVIAGYKELKVLKFLPELNPDEIACLNEYGQALNHAQQREMASSEKVLGAVTALCVLFCVLSFSLGGLIFLPVFAASYMMPNYMKCNGMPWFLALSNFLVKAATFSSATLIVGMMTIPESTTVTRTTVIRANGTSSSWEVEDLPMDSILFKAMAVVLICAFILFSPIVIMFLSTIGFIRHYLMDK